jgi:hypothetical protein
MLEERDGLAISATKPTEGDVMSSPNHQPVTSSEALRAAFRSRR